MQKFRYSLLVLGLAALIPSLWAATEPQLTAGAPAEQVPLDIFTAKTSYVFESDLNHGGNLGKQDELEVRFEYAHRILLTNQWYLHLGVGYDRFDFGRTSAPVPDHLQSGALVIGIDYMKGADTGAFLQFRPGFYTENNIGLASFDCPILVGRFWTLQPDKLYLLTGVYTSFLWGGFPVLPLAGVVWHPNDNIRVMGILPDPRVIYTVNKQLEVFLGGELAGGSFRTDHHNNYVGPNIAKLSGAQVDYINYRAGGGFVYHLTNAISIDGNAGWSIQRAFYYHRAEENYRTDPAPYLQIALKASF